MKAVIETNSTVYNTIEFKVAEIAILWHIHRITNFYCFEHKRHNKQQRTPMHRILLNNYQQPLSYDETKSTAI